MDINELNAVGLAKSTLKILPLSKLVPEEIFVVHQIKQVHTKYGPSYLLHLADKIGVFLPKRINEHLTSNPKTLTALQEQIQEKKLGVKYAGSGHNKVGSEYYKIEFVQL